MNLERAIEIAVEAHAGGKDRGGKAYILHPLSVMMRVETERKMAHPRGFRSVTSDLCLRRAARSIQNKQI